MMTDGERAEAMAAWLASRPESVRKLAAEFPLGSRFDLGGRTLFLFGYTESDMLVVSAVDPAVDYEAAHASREHVCATHFRSARG